MSLPDSSLALVPSHRVQLWHRLAASALQSMLRSCGCRNGTAAAELLSQGLPGIFCHDFGLQTNKTIENTDSPDSLHVRVTFLSVKKATCGRLLDVARLKACAGQTDHQGRLGRCCAGLLGSKHSGPGLVTCGDATAAGGGGGGGGVYPALQPESPLYNQNPYTLQPRSLSRIPTLQPVAKAT